jgi:hypothetical protein
MEGQADVERLASSVREVSGATSLASDGLASLERAITVLTATVDQNTAALEGMEGGFTRTTAGANKLAGGTRVVTNELRMMEGAMPIRAAAQFLAQMEGLNAVMQMAFPIFGAIALVGVLDTIIEHVEKWANAHNPVLAAQKESLSLLEKEGKEYDKLAEKARRFHLDEYERTHGKEARQRLEAVDDARKASQEDADQIARLEDLLTRLNRLTHVTQLSNGGVLTANATSGDQALAGQLRAALGLKPTDKTGLEGIEAGNGISVGQAHAASELSVGVDQALATARMQQTVDLAQATDISAKADAEDRKKADEETKKRKQELATAEKQAAAYLREAQGFELTGLARINEKYREKLELLGKTPKAIADINAAHAIEVERETTKEVHAGAMKLDALRGKWQHEVESGHATYDEASGAYFVKPKDPKKLQLTGYSEAQQKQDEKDVASILKLLGSADDTDADAVRRQLGVTTKENALAVSGGRMSGGAGAGADYSARLAAANEIFRIETQHLDLIDDENRRQEKLASARKKYAEEVFRAEEQYENQLQALREKDLQKYQGMAGSLFDALRSHSTAQWGKDFLTGQARQMFTNVAAPVLQSAGHMLGGVIPSSSQTGILGTLVHGTVFDAANKGNNDSLTAAKSTAQHTADTVAELKALRTALSGQTGDPSTVTTPDVFNLPLMGGGGGISSALGGLFGSSSTLGSSALFNAGNGSGFSQFISGLSGAGSNPWKAIFSGMSDNGDTETQLTGAQRAGAAVSTGAQLAGEGYAAYTGFKAGGAKGALAGTSGVLGMASSIPGPQQPYIAAASAITGIASSLLGDPKTKRSGDITNELAKNVYLAPTVMNVVQGMNGTYEDFDSRGNLRTSNFSAVPLVAEPYITSRVQDGQRTYYDVPGQVTSPFTPGPRGSGQGPVAGTGGLTVIVQGDLHAMDAASFHEFIRRPSNSHSVGEAMADHLERHDGRASNAIRYISGS